MYRPRTVFRECGRGADIYPSGLTRVIRNLANVTSKMHILHWRHVCIRSFQHHSHKIRQETCVVRIWKSFLVRENPLSNAVREKSWDRYCTVHLHLAIKVNSTYCSFLAARGYLLATLKLVAVLAAGRRACEKVRTLEVKRQLLGFLKPRLPL
jgi:hypothetical protein